MTGSFTFILSSLFCHCGPVKNPQISGAAFANWFFFVLVFAAGGASHVQVNTRLCGAHHVEAFGQDPVQGTAG